MRNVAISAELRQTILKSVLPFLMDLENNVKDTSYVRETAGNPPGFEVITGLQINEMVNKVASESYGAQKPIEVITADTEKISVNGITALGWQLQAVTQKVFRNRFMFTKDNFVMVLDMRAPISHVEIALIDPSKVEWLLAPEHFRCIIPCETIQDFKTIERLLHLKNNITAEQAGIGYPYIQF